MKQCPKCGSTTILTTYVPATKQFNVLEDEILPEGVLDFTRDLIGDYGLPDGTVKVIHTECLYHQCECTYTWLTPTLNNIIP